jgi:hypothetical protein
MKSLLALLLSCGTAIAQTTVTPAPVTPAAVSSPPLTVTVTSSVVTITGATPSPITIPVPSAPLTCAPPQPASTTATVQCPSGSTGSYTQTTAYMCSGTTWVGTVSPTSAPAGACTTTPPPTVSSLVYGNGVINWTFNMSYGATVNYTDTAGAPLTGTMDAAITVPSAGGWQPGVSTACQNGGTGCFDTTPYTYFVFSIKPTASNTLANLIMAWHSPGDVTNGTQGVAIGQYCSATVGVWGSCKVPLSAFSLSSKVVSKFALQSNVAATFYVNGVGFQ